VRIARVSVDGYGPLRELDLELGAGLTVLAGPNEAGKSTLLGFCTAMLFDFPRKGSAGFGPPLRGGRHGGSLSVVDDSGDPWTIERYTTPSRSLVVHRPDGTLGGEPELRHLLGGASAELFAAVFAVDLDGLATVRSVSSDEVREALFTSAVLGQRRSASKAIQELQGERLLLARPRNGDARANLLASELQAIRTELSEARRAADGLGGTRALLEALDDERDQLRGVEASLSRRADELELLERAWERLGDGREAADRLADLPPLEPQLKRLLEYEDEVRASAVGWSGHLERLGQRDRLLTQLAGLSGRISSGLSSLGGHMSEDGVLAVRHDVVTREQLRRIEATRQGLAGRLEDARRAAESAARDLLAVEQARPDPPSVAGSEAATPAPAPELEARARSLAELRRRLADRQLLAAAMAQDAAAPRSASPRTLPVVMALGGAVLAVLAVVAVVTRASTALSVGCGTLSLAALVAAGVLAWRGVRAARGAITPDAEAETSDAGRSEPARRRRQFEELDQRIALLASLLGMGAHPTSSDVEVEAGRIEDARAARRLLDQAEERVGRARGAVASADSLLREIEAQLVECDHDFARWREVAGLPDGFGMAAASEALELAAQVQEDVAGRRRIEAALSTLGDQIESYAGGLARLAADLDDELPPVPAEQAVWLEGRSSELEECRQLAVQRAMLEQTVSRAEQEVAHLLGTGERAEQLRDELERGALLDWQREHQELRRSLAAAREEEERLVRQHETARLELDELLSSTRISELEAREAETEAELDDVLRRVMTLGCARALISTTLDRHESERQPEVLRRAGDHFRRITSGRYERITVDPTEAARPVVRAVSARGESVDAAVLSRGTAEQLYLSLRLGLAEEFAERAVALPVVLDDVLVNFDEERARAVVEDLAETATRRQVLLFTCHPHIVKLVEETLEEPRVVRLERV